MFSEVKFLFDEFSRCLEVPSHEQTLPFFPFRSKDYSEYKRIFVEPFLQCQFYFFRDSRPLKSTKIAKIRRSGAGGGDVNQVI